MKNTNPGKVWNCSAFWSTSWMGFFFFFFFTLQHQLYSVCSGVQKWIVQHSQLLMLCSRARIRASFPFHFRVLVHIFVCLLYILFFIPFQCICRPVGLRKFSSGFFNFFFRSQIFFSSNTLRGLLVPWVGIPALFCVWEWAVGGYQGDFCSPATIIISQHITGLCGTSSRLARRLLCPPFSPWCWDIHSCRQWWDAKGERVLAGTITVCCYHPCIGLLQDFPWYTLISWCHKSVQNWIKFLLKLLWKNKIRDLSPHPSLYPYTHKGIHSHFFLYFSFLWHQEPKCCISVRTTGVASFAPLILFSWGFCSCIAAPGCWNSLTTALSMQVIVHCCLWRRLEDIAVFSKRTLALSCKINRQDRKKK